jgi:asparagine synthase (glutamine-hydrolysing)
MSGLLCVHSPRASDEDPPRYLAALRRLAHRGADGEGTHHRAGLFLGVRWSSVGAAGAPVDQPVIGGNGRFVLALDGHIHNRRELAHRLRAGGCRDDLASDPALVLAAYTHYGVPCFERLRGVWAVVLWDAHEERLWLGRDRLGVRPLYYYVGARQLLVASEIKSIIALDRQARAVDHRRVRDLVVNGRIDDWTATCFSGIRPVSPGTVMGFHRERVTTNRYWTLQPVTDQSLRPVDIRERLVNAVERHTPSDVTVGLALSGGIDSSSIAGVLARASQRDIDRIRAFSIVPPHTTDESFLIDATIRDTGLPHTYVPLDTLDYPRSLARVVDFHDEPVQSSGVFYQFALRQHMAEAGCRAVLVGYGSDEIFSGYRHLAPAFLTALAAHGRARDWARFVLGASEFLESSRVQIVRQMLYYARTHAGASWGRRLPRFPGLSVPRPGKDAPALGADILSPADGDLRPDPFPAVPAFELHGVDGGLDFFNALLQCFRTNVALLVRLEDRNAMAHGLELCAPFLDEELVQAALAFPFYRFMEGGRNKAVLRHAAHDVLAPEVRDFQRKLNTPGNDGHLVFDVLRPQFLELLQSASFKTSGLWSGGCEEQYRADAVGRERGHLWFRVYMTQQWYDRVVHAA